ncbi:MAG: hypothetical protein MRY83_12350, partial [Flavobacteriales bacterium]|nr:hypothetical protein [Flavobacteriales bacterium]
MKRILFLAIAALAIIVDANATHVAGGNITYECLGQNSSGHNEYEITYTLYRACENGNSTKIDPEQPMVYSNSCNQSIPLTFTLVSDPDGVDVTPTCFGTNTLCDDDNSPYEGYEYFIFKDTVALPVQCADWMVQACLNARNNTIGTIQNPGSEIMCVRSRINNTGGICNNSPVFTNDPVGFLCLGNQFCFNNGAFDADGDSLVYEQIVPQGELIGAVPTAIPSTVNYLSGFSETMPTGDPMSFDVVNGNFCITSTWIGKTVTAIRVNEYRNGVLIGSIIRDIQLYVQPCNNGSPQISGLDSSDLNSSTDTTVCIGSTLEFALSSFDPDGDSLVMSANLTGMPAGATFTITPGVFPSGTFNWTPTLADVRTAPYCFTVTVEDLYDCQGYSRTFTKGYCITVREGTPFTVTLDPAGPFCDNDAVQQLNGSPVKPGYSFYTGSGITDNVQGFFDPGVAGAGTHNITYTVSDSGFCPKSAIQTISVLESDGIDLGPNLSTCTQNPINLAQNLTISGSNGPYTYNWFPATGLDCNTCAAPQASPNQTTKYFLELTNSNGCKTLDSVILNVNQTTLTADGGGPFCTGGTMQIGGTPTASGGNGPYVYNWTPTQNIINPSDPNPYINMNDPSITNLSFFLTVTDADGCYRLDTVVVTKTTLQAEAGDDQCGAVGAIVMLGGNQVSSGGQPPYNYSWTPGTFLDNPSKKKPKATIQPTPIWYELVLTDANGCVDVDSVLVGPSNSAPIVDAGGVNGVLCTGGTIQVGGNPTAIGGTPPLTYTWTPSNVLNNASISNPYASITSSTLFYVTVTDGNGCSGIDSV